MNQSLQKALYLVSQKHDINEVAAEDLHQLTQRFPYFSLPHLLLSRKLKEGSEEGFLRQAQKTAVYINDPFWLHYQLYSAGEQDEPVEEAAREVFPVEQTPKELQLQSPLSPEVVNEPETTTQEDDAQQIPDELHPDPEVIQEEIASGETIPYSDQQEESAAPAEAEETAHILVGEDVSAEVPKPVSVSEEELEADEQLLLQITRHDEPAPQPAETILQSELATKPDLEQQVAAGIEGHTTFSKDIEARTKALINPQQATNNAGIPFEPYHTIDYFASQGIQLVLDNNPEDKLGKQLKKFTQWLKHMKRLGPEDALETVKDTHLETTIQKIADTSNTPRDIVTETMAEVLVKQGKTVQAVQLYEKLSFLNPGKSAYFAAKIQTLKGS